MDCMLMLICMQIKIEIMKQINKLNLIIIDT